MVFNIIVLFITALFGGLLAYRFRSKGKFPFRLTLIFAGSYLFAITIVHVLPELFMTTRHPALVGIVVLAGFYMQQILEYFTAGAEHGHMHPLEQTNEHHEHHSGTAISLVIALSIHSFLEGTLVGHPAAVPGEHDSFPLLVGIVLHKMPAAFAMMTILLCHFKHSRWPLVYLLVFTLASPIGVVFSSMGVESGLLTEHGVDILFALVAGSFLHISTTIVFEGSPGHKFKFSRLLVGIIGALMAVGVELLH
jgi:zinc transporter ZupT